MRKKLSERIKFNGLNLSNEIKVGDFYTLITRLNGQRNGIFMSSQEQHFQLFINQVLENEYKVPLPTF